MSITEKMRKAFDACTVMAGVEPDFECVYMTKDAALLYLDEIDAENAKLRSELESVGTAAYLYGRSDLKAENANLREIIANFEKLLPESERWYIHETVKAIAEDNAKLRKLLLDVWNDAIRFDGFWDYVMDDGELYSKDELPHYQERMRELGIEVDYGQQRDV